MPAAWRKFLAVTALAALVCGLVHDRPCADDDACTPDPAAFASPECPASDRHHDPEDPDHGCLCLCHVPALGSVQGPVPAPAIQPGPAPVAARSNLRPGATEPPFHPPRA